MFDALRQYNFGTRFLDWLAILFSPASTRCSLTERQAQRSLTERQAQQYGTSVGFAKVIRYHPSSSCSWSTRLVVCSTTPQSWASYNSFTRDARCIGLC